MTEAVLDPDAGTISDRALEVAVNMSQVPPVDKCNLFQCFGDMLKDEVVKLSLKLQTKYNQVVENLRMEKINSRALSNDLRSLQAAVKGKGSGKVDPHGHVISELQKQGEDLKHKLNMPGFQHVQTAELAQIEKDKSDLADSLAKEKEERDKIENEMAALKQERDELQTRWDTHVCAAPVPVPEVSDTTIAQLTKTPADLQVVERQVHTAQQKIQELEARLKENGKLVAALQKEVEEAKQEKLQQEKSIKDLTNRMKGNVTLLEARRLIWTDIIAEVLEARRLIWTDIIAEVRKRWAFLTLIEEKRAAVRRFRRMHATRRTHRGCNKSVNGQKVYHLLEQLELRGIGNSGSRRQIQGGNRAQKDNGKRSRAHSCIRQSGKDGDKFGTFRRGVD